MGFGEIGRHEYIVVCAELNRGWGAKSSIYVGHIMWFVIGY